MLIRVIKMLTLAVGMIYYGKFDVWLSEKLNRH